MNFLLNANVDGAIWIVLAVGVILAICFFIYKSKRTSTEIHNTLSTNEPPLLEESNITKNDDEEIIAVIAAAIAAAEADSNGLKFKVVSFRRI